ncbi:MAG: anaerobic ribonucleoside-triphosphate reductase [Lachnospiraceae bacterium]|nr:anaerobic ribonucleoside-triphosphate reductase [Lachnospiraceae bacterium]
MKITFELIKRDGETVYFSNRSLWIKALIRKAADKVLIPIDDEEIEEINSAFFQELVSLSTSLGRTRFENEEWRECIKKSMAAYPEICNAFLFAHKEENADLYEQICKQMKEITLDGDRSNGSVDSSLTSSKRALTVDAVEKITYSNYHLTPEQREACNDGYIYIHDMGHRRDAINCCLFDMENVLTNGFEMGEMWYDEPASLSEAFDVIASVSINAAAQIYGGFTIPQIDELLSKYAKKSFDLYVSEYSETGIEKQQAAALADKKIEKDFEKGFSALEAKFNSLISPRGDYPFITISFGIGRDKYSQMATRMALKVRKEGHGKDGFKRPVLFPKLVFLYDKNLHAKGMELYHLFQDAVDCSSKVMYPEYLSLTGERGIVSEVYKKYGKVISPMCCRAFLTKWFEKGGEEPADENDMPIFIGRFNIGVVSLNLPMILAKSRENSGDFFKTLDYYLELIRQIHKSTYRFLAEKKAYTNPLAFMQGGLYGGHLDRDDKIEPLLKSATASYGVTALNELQRLYNGKSIVEDGAFALETAQYINHKVSEFQVQDHIQYSVYGTPAESLCGKQVRQFREKYGIIENVSDRDYFSNSFHCHVSEDISQIEKQEYEARFWDLFNGGKIQYVRIDVPYNIPALETYIKHAMDLGLYEGINISLAYCDNCGFQWNNIKNDRPQICPRCKKNEMTLIDRMCGYLAFTRVHGKTRLNEAKMAEINDRICM